MMAKNLCMGGLESGSSNSSGRGFGRRDGRLFVTVRQLPGRAVAQQALHQRGVHGVAGALSNNAAPDAPAGEREIANQVQHFVTNELVREAQRWIFHAATADDDGTRTRRSTDKAHIAQHGFVFAKAKGTRGRNELGIGAGFEIAGEGLHTNGRGEVDCVIDGIAFAWIDAYELGTFARLSTD